MNSSAMTEIIEPEQKPQIPRWLKFFFGYLCVTGIITVTAAVCTAVFHPNRNIVILFLTICAVFTYMLALAAIVKVSIKEK